MRSKGRRGISPQIAWRRACSEVFAQAVSQSGKTGGNIPAVNGDLGAADEARFIRGEEQHKIGALLWGPLPLHRYRGARGVREGFTGSVEKAGIGDLSGMDRIDSDVPLRELQHCSLGQSPQPPFASGVGGVV